MTLPTEHLTSVRARTISKIAIGVNGGPESHDAITLATAIAGATRAEVLLVGVHPEPLVVLPEEMNWISLQLQTGEKLAQTRDSYAPEARIAVETGLSVPRVLERVVRREHSDLLVVGSSRHATAGRVQIGKRSRQLLSELRCAVAIAPRGLHRKEDYRLRHVGVGYDGHHEATDALVLAGSLAHAADADLHICGVVDDRLSPPSWSATTTVDPLWEERIAAEMDALRDFGLSAVSTTGARAQAEIARGRPADHLLKLSESVDLLVIGSRRWGAVARVLLGSTGEALAHGAACPLLVAPRPGMQRDG